jgi:cobalt-zinc-cadmium efflux system outer membrane protein
VPFIFKCFLKQFSAVLLLIIFSHSSRSAELTEPPKLLRLEVALGLAMGANPEISVALREQEATEGVRIQAGVRHNPYISSEIQDTRSDTQQITLQFNQEIELGNKRESRLALADILHTKATAELDALKATIHANTVNAFYEVLVAQERLALSKSSFEVANAAVNAATKRVNAGKSSPVEETKSNIAASSAKIELNQSNSQLNSARKRLSALWGNPFPVFEQAYGDVENIPLVPSFENLLALLENAPAIGIANLEVSARGGSTKLARSQSTPNITISAGIVHNNELGLNQALIGLSVPIPLFDRNQGNVQEAVSLQYKAQDELIALKTQLATKLAGEHERLSVARLSAISLREEILPGAQNAFEAANKGFNAGKFNFLDVLDAQRTLFQAKSQYIQVLLDAHQAIAEIESILGHVVTHPAQQEKE